MIELFPLSVSFCNNETAQQCVALTLWISISANYPIGNVRGARGRKIASYMFDRRWGVQVSPTNYWFTANNTTFYTYHG